MSPPFMQLTLWLLQIAVCLTMFAHLLLSLVYFCGPAFPCYLQFTTLLNQSHVQRSTLKFMSVKRAVCGHPSSTQQHQQWSGQPETLFFSATSPCALIPSSALPGAIHHPLGTSQIPKTSVCIDFMRRWREVHSVQKEYLFSPLVYITKMLGRGKNKQKTDCLAFSFVFSNGFRPPISCSLKARRWCSDLKETPGPLVKRTVEGYLPNLQVLESLQTANREGRPCSLPSVFTSDAEAKCSFIRCLVCGTL